MERGTTVNDIAPYVSPPHEAAAALSGFSLIFDMVRSRFPIRASTSLAFVRILAIAGDREPWVAVEKVIVRVLFVVDIS